MQQGADELRNRNINQAKVDTGSVNTDNADNGGDESFDDIEET